MSIVINTFFMLLPYLQKGRLEAGCDEAGRGCLAGPVFAAAVILPLDIEERIAAGQSRLSLLNDSKQLTEKQRYQLRPIIEEEALAWAVGTCTHAEIDKLNILRASIEAMHRAVKGLYENGSFLDPHSSLKCRPEYLLIDGNRFTPFIGIPHQTIVKGDGKMMSIAAASILAKTYRDDFMVRLHGEYPYYDWKTNKGYPTKKHRAGIAAHGASPYHRMSFTLLPSDPQLEIKFED